MTTQALFMWLLTFALTLTAAWTDWRSRRIPNWLTVPGAAAGVAANAVLWGRNGLRGSLEGLALGLALLMPLVLLRAVGAGDWKLTGALGAFLGPRALLAVLLVAILVSGVMAVAQVALAGRMKSTLANMWTLVRGFFVFGLSAHPSMNLDNPGLMKLPFGVATALATLICFALGRARF